MAVDLTPHHVTVPALFGLPMAVLMLVAPRPLLQAAHEPVHLSWDPIIVESATHLA